MSCRNRSSRCRLPLRDILQRNYTKEFKHSELIIDLLCYIVIHKYAVIHTSPFKNLNHAVGEKNKPWTWRSQLHVSEKYIICGNDDDDDRRR
jgi:hypothetical protein